jgi:hypothetical protein
MRTSNEPKLVLEFQQMAAFKNIIFEAKNEYKKTCDNLIEGKPTFLKELGDAHLKYFYLDDLYTELKDELTEPKHTYKLYINIEGCFHLLGIILPANNNEWLKKVIEIVLEFCVNNLKYYGILPNMPTYRPVLPTKEVLTANSWIDWSKDIDDETP